jgi:hypothetical protein
MTAAPDVYRSTLAGRLTSQSSRRELTVICLPLRSFSLMLGVLRQSMKVLLMLVCFLPFLCGQEMTESMSNIRKTLHQLASLSGADNYLKIQEQLVAACSGEEKYQELESITFQDDNAKVRTEGLWMISQIKRDDHIEAIREWIDLETDDDAKSWGNVILKNCLVIEGLKKSK